MIIEHFKTNKQTSPMKDSESKGYMAGFPENEDQRDYVNITDMIRSLQRTEGLADCFRRNMTSCDQIECAWRQYCLQK